MGSAFRERSASVPDTGKICENRDLGGNAAASGDALMLSTKSSYKLSLLGAFRFETGSGERIQVSSKRARALLGLLAVAPNGERSRRWLETMLWSTRSPAQAQSSLRKELFNLRHLLDAEGVELIGADASAIWLNLDCVDLDLLGGAPSTDKIFLEGLDLEGEEPFEDWLRERRQEFAAIVQSDAGAAPMAERSVSRDLDLAVAVLPLDAEAGNETLEIAAFGIGEELINRLSRLRWLPVIARSSSFSVPAEARNATQAGALLGARYIIEGSLKPFGDDFRLQIGLTDAQNGKAIWTEAFQLERVDELTSIEAALTGITAALDHKVDQSEQARALAAQSDYRDVMQLVWQARWHFSKLTEEGMVEAGRLLEKAQALAPMSAEILIEQVWLTIRELWLRRGTHEEIRALRKLAQKASNADPDDARGYMLCGIAEFWLHKPDRAERLLRRAIELNPSLVMAHAQLGSCLHHQGECEDAIDALQSARRLSPNDQDLFFTEGELAMAHLTLGHFEQAIDHAEASLARRAAYWSAHVAKINAHVGLKQWGEARQAYAELLEVQPGFRAHYIDWLPYADASRNAVLRDGLNQARARDD